MNPRAALYAGRDLTPGQRKLLDDMPLEKARRVLLHLDGHAILGPRPRASR